MRIPWTARRSNQSILKEINSEYSLEGLMLKLKLQYFGHLMQRTDSFEKTLVVKSLSHVRLFANLWTAAYQAPWSKRFERAREVCKDQKKASKTDSPNKLRCQGYGSSFSSVQFSSVQLLSRVHSLQPHEPQHAKPPCPSPTPGVQPNPCPLSW